MKPRSYLSRIMFDAIEAERHRMYQQSLKNPEEIYEAFGQATNQQLVSLGRLSLSGQDQLLATLVDDILRAYLFPSQEDARDNLRGMDYETDLNPFSGESL